MPQYRAPKYITPIGRQRIYLQPLLLATCHSPDVCLTGGGNGLWTSRFFRRNELITEYFGPIIDHKKALTLRYKNKHSHIRVLNLQFRYIDGIKKPQLGVGGASFANDARDPGKTNAVFISR